MNLQVACPNQNSCLVSCQDPNHTNECVVLQTQLIDGSPCSYGGMCSGGTCQPGTPINTLKAWYTQNLQISIPVTVVVAIVLLLLLWASVTGIMRCRARSRSRLVAQKNLGVANMQRLPSQDISRKHVPWVPPPMPPPLPPSLRPGSSAAFAQSPSRVPYRGQIDDLVPTSALSPSVHRDRMSRSGGNMRELILTPNVTRPPEWVDAALYNGRGR